MRLSSSNSSPAPVNRAKPSNKGFCYSLVRRHTGPLLRLITFLFFCLPFLAQAQESLVSFQYDERGDEQCALSRNYEIKKEWVDELRSRLPEMQALWKTAAPPLLAAVNKLTSRPIDLGSTAIRLTLCELPSQSKFGVSVNMRFALRSFTAQPVPLRYKVDTAFHEVLHGFITRYAPKNSQLLKQHESESSCVRNHLHLLSLQKAVLISTGEKAELQDVVTIDTQLPTGCYAKAWAIVNESDNPYKQYVRELASGT